jgi:hypothetical protein
MPAEPTIDYDRLAQEAMRSIVRTVLTQAAKSGLPGEHHFYISFDTGATGVVLSKRLKDKYPHEMTIVLQHRFWDLSVGDDGFEVKLTFDGIPERLVVPFAAIRVFFDPSVRYGLQFEDPSEEPEAGEHMAQRFSGRVGSGERTNGNGARTTLRSTAPKKPRVPRKTKSEKAADKASEKLADKMGDKLAGGAPPVGSNEPHPPPPHTLHPKSANGAPKPASDKAGDKPRQDNGGAQIVSLDAFRKK